jgi:hypothetical protein
LNTCNPEKLFIWYNHNMSDIESFTGPIPMPSMLVATGKHTGGYASEQGEIDILIELVEKLAAERAAVETKYGLELDTGLVPSFGQRSTGSGVSVLEMSGIIYPQEDRVFYKLTFLSVDVADKLAEIISHGIVL